MSVGNNGDVKPANRACAACGANRPAAEGERTVLTAVRSRRAMLGAAALGVLGVAATCGDESDTKDNGGAASKPVMIAKANVPALNGEPYASDDGDFYLVHNKDGVLAFSWKCTHQGCKVPWQASEDCFHCPCHGSKFDYDGVSFAGPAKRPLDLVKVAVQQNGDVAVAADEKTKCSDYEPSQAARYPAWGSDAGVGAGDCIANHGSSE